MSGRGTYEPRRAWAIAAAYFCACVAVAAASGALAKILEAPLATGAQLADGAWLALTIAYALVVIVGYAVIWPIGTFTDGRKRHALLALAYGATWGICQGLLFVSFWTLVARSGLATGWVAVITYGLIGGYNACYHRFFWDIYVSPPHNYTEWNVKKVLACHTPNLVVGITYLALYGSFGVFVLLQGLALAASAFFMRFPAPWDDYTAIAGAERPIATKA